MYMYTYTLFYLCIGGWLAGCVCGWLASLKEEKQVTHIGLYNIFVTEAVVYESTILSPPPRLPALPTLVQYDCTIIGQYKTPLPTSRLYAVHHTILVITISCKGQVPTWNL